MSRLKSTSTSRPEIKLPRLRQIGWSLWDPIGLLGSEQNWCDEDCLPFVDEYDSYLMQAAWQLRKGVSDTDVINYLALIEAEHMGLGASQAALKRAEQVVAAILADNDLWTM